MAWPEHRIDDWHHFQQVANDLLPPTDPSHVPFLFRGNSTTFPDLTPSLTRFVLRLTPEDALGVEEQIGRHFRSLLHLYAHAVGIDSLMPPFEQLKTWIVMQHYGAATRLLDWTASIYVAAYFAVERSWDQDGVIWFFHGQALRQAMLNRYQEDAIALAEDGLRDPNARPSVQPLFPSLWAGVVTDRMLAQQSAFTFSPAIFADHHHEIETTIVGYGDCPSVLYGRLLIPAKLKREFLRRLYSLNVTAASLFPGIDGMGRAVAELLAMKTGQR